MALLLLDTHIVLWAASQPDRLSAEAVSLLEDPANVPAVSAATFWEISVKNAVGRRDLQVDPHALRDGLRRNGYRIIPITGGHGLAVGGLPKLHKDPFDRILIAQAEREGAILLTRDSQIARYPFPFIRMV